MLLIWVAYTFFYTTVLWFHLNAPNLITTDDDFVRTLTETSAFTPVPAPPIVFPTSSRIPVPDTIIFPASPLPTARLLHKALPLCYDGLHDDLPLVAGTRTATGTTAELVADSPGLCMRHLLAASVLASTLARSTLGLAIICISGLVCASRILFVVRRTVFEVAASPSRTVCHLPCGRDLNARRVAPSAIDAVHNSAPSPSLSHPPSPSPSSSPSPSLTSPFKKLATTSPALTKTERLIARKRRNCVRKQVPAKRNCALTTPPVNLPLPPPPPTVFPPIFSTPNNSPPETVEVDTRVWFINDSSALEYTALVEYCKERASPVGVCLAALD